MHSGTINGKSFTMFSLNQGLLGRCVEAVQEGEKLARSSGQIQSFEVFRNGFRMTLVLGHIMIIPPSVCSNKEDFPTTLLYGALVQELRPEDLSDLLSAKIGESSFDEYDEVDMQEIKEKLFKVPGTNGKYSCLVTFVPSWMSPREYVYFKYDKDPEKLANALRHLVFAAFYDPRLSSAFDHIMQDTDTVDHGTELDVANITPKLPYPGVSEGILKAYPDLQGGDETLSSQDRPTGSDKKKKKKGSANKPKMVLAADTANQAVADILSEGEVDVLSAVTDATEAAILSKRVTPTDAAEDDNAAKAASGLRRRQDYEKKARLVSAAGQVPCPHCKHSASVLALEAHIKTAHKHQLSKAKKTAKTMEWCATTPKEHADHKNCPGVVDGAKCDCACHTSKVGSKKVAYNPGEEVYIYQGALLCAGCGSEVKAELDTEMNADGHPLKPEGDETTYDSDAYPKGPYPDGGGEADGPQACDICRKFLENPLTQDGYEYLRSMVHEAEAKGRGNEPHILEWKAFYPEAFSASDDEDPDYNLGVESSSKKEAYGEVGNTPQDNEITELFKKKDQLKAEGKDKIKGGEYDAILRELQTKTKARLGSLKAKIADTADNAANEADGAGTIKVKTETDIKNTRGTEPELAPSKNAAAKEAKDVNGMFPHPDADRARRNHPDLGKDLTSAYRLGGYLAKDDAPQAVRDHINSTYVMESSIHDSKLANKTAAGRSDCTTNKAGTEFCAECGSPIAFDLDSQGVSHHVTEWGEINYDLDAQHTPYGEGENFLDGPTRTNAGADEAVSSRTMQARSKHEAKLNLVRKVADESDDLLAEVLQPFDRITTEEPVAGGDGRPEYSKGEAETHAGDPKPGAEKTAAGHKPGCGCGFCKNKGSFGKKDEDKKDEKEPKEASVKTAARPIPQKGSPEWHQLQVAIKGLKMPPAMLGVMGGPGVEESKQILAQYGLVWDDADYSAGGKGVKRAAGHKPGCGCGFCKNKGSFGKKDEDKDEKESKEASGELVPSMPHDMEPAVDLNDGVKPTVEAPIDLDKQAKSVPCPSCGGTRTGGQKNNNQYYCADCRKSFAPKQAARPVRQRVSCDQCNMLSINGVPCHEHGCPNSGAQWNPETQGWNKTYECRECGDDVPEGETCSCQQPFEDEAEQARFGNLDRTAALWLGEESTDIPKRASSKKKTASTQRVIATLDDLLYAEPFDPNNEEHPASSLMKGLVEGPIDGGSHEDGTTAGPQNKVADEEITSDDQVAPKADGHKDTFKESTQPEGGQLAGPQNVGEPPNINAMREQVEVVDEMDKHKSITDTEDEVANKEMAEAAAALVPAEETTTEVVEAPIGSGKIVINITAGLHCEWGNCVDDAVAVAIPEGYEDGQAVCIVHAEEALESGVYDVQDISNPRSHENGVEAGGGDDYNVEPITSGMTNGNFGGDDSVLINPKESAGGPTPIPAAEDPQWQEGQRTYEINRLEKALRDPRLPDNERAIAKSQLDNYRKMGTYTGFKPTNHIPDPAEMNDATKMKTPPPPGIPPTPKNNNNPEIPDTKEAATMERPQGASQEVNGYWNWETYYTDLIIDNSQVSKQLKNSLAARAAESSGGDVASINIDALANQFSRTFREQERQTKEFHDNNAREMPDSEWGTKPFEPVNWHEIAEKTVTDSSLQSEYDAGKSVQKTPGITSSKKAADAKEAGFNFWFPGQVLKEFYPEVQHEIVDYPNADNHPMIQDIDLEPGKVGQQDAGYTSDREIDKEAAGSNSPDHPWTTGIPSDTATPRLQETRDALEMGTDRETARPTSLEDRLRMQQERNERDNEKEGAYTATDDDLPAGFWPESEAAAHPSEIDAKADARKSHSEDVLNSLKKDDAGHMFSGAEVEENGPKPTIDKRLTERKDRAQGAIDSVNDKEATGSGFNYVSTDPGAIGIGRDGKPEVLEGAPLRKENDIRGPMFTDEFYANYPGIPGKYMASSMKKNAAASEKKEVLADFLKKVVGEIAVTFASAFKVTSRPVELDKVPGTGNVNLSTVENSSINNWPTYANDVGGRIKSLLEEMNDSDIQDAINDAWAQAAVWHSGSGSGNFTYEVFVRAESIDTDAMILKYKFVTGTK